MKVIEGQIVNWKYYISEATFGDKIQNCGKWMYFFSASDIDDVSRLCKEAVELEVLTDVKHTAVDFLTDTGVACFYVNGLERDQHVKVLNYFMKNNLVPKNKNGNYRNIAFKFDSDTQLRNYGNTFKAKLNLSDFVDVATGEFIQKNLCE